MFLSADSDPVPSLEADGHIHNFGFPRLLSPGFDIMEDSVVPDSKLPGRHRIRPYSLSRASGQLGLIRGRHLRLASERNNFKSLQPAAPAVGPRGPFTSSIALSRRRRTQARNAPAR